MYKTFLPDKIIVHFPIKILKYFIKSKGNKRSLIPFSTKQNSLGLSHTTLCLRKAWLLTCSWSPASDRNALYTAGNLLAQSIWSRLGSWHQNRWRILKNQDEREERALSRVTGLVRTPKPLSTSTVCSSRSNTIDHLIGLLHIHCKKNSTLASNSVNILKLRVKAKESLDIRGKDGSPFKSSKCIRKNCAYNVMTYDSKIQIFLSADWSVNTAWDRNVISSYWETKVQPYAIT